MKSTFIYSIGPAIWVFATVLTCWIPWVGNSAGKLVKQCYFENNTMNHREVDWQEYITQTTQFFPSVHPAPHFHLPWKYLPVCPQNSFWTFFFRFLLCDFPLHLPLELLGVDLTLQVKRIPKKVWFSEEFFLRDCCDYHGASCPALWHCGFAAFDQSLPAFLPPWSLNLSHINCRRWSRWSCWSARWWCSPGTWTRSPSLCSPSPTSSTLSSTCSPSSRFFQRPCRSTPTSSPSSSRDQVCLSRVQNNFS